MQMETAIEYTAGERRCFWVLAFVGLFGLNGAFVLALLLQPGALGAALSNPLSLAFILEALLLTGVFAYLLPRWGVSRLHWAWFVALSLLGGLAFALPVALLVTARGRPFTDRSTNRR